MCQYFFILNVQTTLHVHVLNHIRFLEIDLHWVHLSLYSTATQNPLRWGFALGNTSNLSILRWVYQHVGIQNTKICVTPKAQHKICITPNLKPQREPMKYRLRWVPNAKLLRWLCTFHVVCAHFIRIGYPMRTRFAVEYGLYN